MKEIDSIQTLKELSKEFRNIENSAGFTDVIQDPAKGCNWRDRFLKLVEEIENNLKRKT
jgi:hypothetical protein